MNALRCFFTLLFCTTTATAYANDHQTGPQATTGVWSMGATTRLFNSPYLGEDIRADFLPEINFQGDNWYLDGSQAGWRSDKHQDLTLDTFARYRFGGYSEEHSSDLDGMRRYGTVEAGAKVTADTALGDISLSAAHDALNRHQGWSSTAEWRWRWHDAQWRIEPFIAADYDSADVNNYFYGVKPSESLNDRRAYSADAALNYRAGIDSWYRLGQPHLFGLSLSHTVFDSSITDSPIVDSSGRTELRLSYRYEFINNRAAQAVAKAGEAQWLKGEWEWRMAGGYWKDGNFIEMVYLNDMASDTSSTAMASGFLSKKITDSTWGLPIQMHVTGGLVHHFEKDLQDDFNEYVIALKGYFTQFPWSHIVETRVGLGYGFSYGDKVPFQESDNVLEKNLNDSRMLQYLDYSWDVNIGDLFRTQAAKHCYAGYSLHHRSGIFGKTEIYNNVDGGSNWNTFYVQCKVR